MIAEVHVSRFVCPSTSNISAFQDPHGAQKEHGDARAFELAWSAPTTGAGEKGRFAIAGCSDSGRELTVKVINAGADPVKAALTIEGLAPKKDDLTQSPGSKLTSLLPGAEVTVLTSGRPTGNNSLESPKRIVPVTMPTQLDPSSVAELRRVDGPKFSRVFPPYSFTLLRLKIECIMTPTLCPSFELLSPPKLWRFTLITAVTAVAIHASADSLSGEDGKLKARPVVPVKVQAFPLEDVRLLDGPFKHAMDLDGQYPLALNVDRLLRNFRVNAGLPTTGRAAGRLGSAGLRTARPFRGSLYVRLRADVRQHRRRAVQGQRRRRSGWAGGVSGEARRAAT